MVDRRLFDMIGPSGSGKGNLMRYGCERLAANPGVVFAHRYLTRPVEHFVRMLSVADTSERAFA